MSDPLEEARRSLEKLLPMMEGKHAELRGQDPAADKQIADSLAQTKAILSDLGGGSGQKTASSGGFFGWLSSFSWFFGKPNIKKLAVRGDVKGLIRALERYDDYDIVTEAIPALADFPDSPEAVDMILLLSRRGHEVYREKAIGALGRIGGDKVVKALLPLLDDPEFGIRQAVIATLGRCRAKAAVSRLVQSLNENNDECTHAAEALVQIGAVSAIPALQVRLQHEKSDYRQGCFQRAISSLQARAGIPPEPPPVTNQGSAPVPTKQSAPAPKQPPAQTPIDKLIFACPRCSKRIGVRSNAAGKSVKCPSCNQVVQIPDAGSAPPAPPPPPAPPKPAAPSFSEKDNLGTRHDTKGLAMAYWMGERLNSTRKDPFVMFTFSKTEDARKALLDLPCIHLARDSNKLICTEPLIFGYYEIEGMHEAVLGGADLTHDLWEQARASFTKHGGTRKNDQEPEKPRAAAPPRKAAQPENIVFLREEPKHGMGGTAIYRIHKGTDKESALAFLKQNPVTQQLLYLVVETPDGNYCRDIQGIYKED